MLILLLEKVDCSFNDMRDKYHSTDVVHSYNETILGPDFACSGAWDVYAKIVAKSVITEWKVICQASLEV